MQTDISVYPPPTHDFRPERVRPRPGSLDDVARVFMGGLMRPLQAGASRLGGVVARVERHGSALKGRTDGDLQEEEARLRMRLRREGFGPEPVAQAFALVREVAARRLGMRHFDCQLVGGWALLKGMVAEMETGEGKTLTATLAAGAAALAGVPVHVITVNDYLAGRDAEWMGPVYRGLGLTVGCIVHGLEPAARRAAYGCDVTYCTNKEVVFDYLRDRMTLGDRLDPLRLQAECLYGDRSRALRLVMRGLHFGIVDEADSVLIDEARTPLVISGKARDEEAIFVAQAIAVAGQLREGEDYRIRRDSREVHLTDAGRHRVRALAVPLDPFWKGSLRREEMLRRALEALRLFRRDEHYLVRDGKVEIVDEFTGRVMPDRSWERGLHQLIEVKEGCKVTAQRETLARISYQRFFRRYLRLAGMTGTAREVSGELWSVYGLPVVRIPVNRPLRRVRCPDRIFPTADAKWRAVVERVRRLHREGRPVLVGTRSVAASERLSGLLTEAGVEHQVLNAKFDREEAEIIARAGERGRVTLATNMAGRGTDIQLAPGVAERGGLHVILTERHEAGRIDRQLAGRCGRQGDPGCHEAFLSLEDPLLEGGQAGLAGWIARRLMQRIDNPMRSGSPLWGRIAGRAILRAQKRLERTHARVRRDLLKHDERRGDIMSFSGRSE